MKSCMNNSIEINSHNNQRIKKNSLHNREKYIEEELYNEFSYSK